MPRVYQQPSFFTCFPCGRARGGVRALALLLVPSADAALGLACAYILAVQMRPLFGWSCPCVLVGQMPVLVVLRCGVVAACTYVCDRHGCGVLGVSANCVSSVSLIAPSWVLRCRIFQQSVALVRGSRQMLCCRVPAAGWLAALGSS